MPVDIITRTDISRWVQWMVSRGQSGKTIRNKHGLISAVFTDALPENAANPCKKARLPDSSPREEPVFLTRDEVDALRAAMPAQWRPLTTWLVATGMRFSEATALQRRHVDLEARMASVARAWKFGDTLRIGPPKTPAGRRTINLPAGALAAVGDMGDLAPTDLVFRNRRGARVTHSRYYDGAWLPATKRPGSQPPLTTCGTPARRG